MIGFWVGSSEFSIDPFLDGISNKTSEWNQQIQKVLEIENSKTAIEMLRYSGKGINQFGVYDSWSKKTIY